MWKMSKHLREISRSSHEKAAKNLHFDDTKNNYDDVRKEAVLAKVWMCFVGGPWIFDVYER
jgi:hypothetical protein